MDGRGEWVEGRERGQEEYWERDIQTERDPESFRVEEKIDKKKINKEAEKRRKLENRREKDYRCPLRARR